LLVVNTQSFLLVYTLVNHPYLGLIIEPHVVQVNTLGKFSLTHQRVFSRTASYFKKGLSTLDFQLLELLDEVDDDFLFRKFHPDNKKKIRTAEFFSKQCSEEMFNEKIRPYIEEKIASVIEKLKGKTIYKTGNDNNPTSVELQVSSEKASVLFHFRKDGEGTRYFPTIKHKGQRIEFMFKGAQIITQNPAWMVLGNQLIDFEKNVDGKKLVPFLNKRFIQISKTAEENYFQKFVTKLVENYDVYAEGFDIKTHEADMKPMLSMQSLFDNNDIALKLQFGYADAVFDYASNQRVQVTLSKKEDSYIFYRTKRNRKREDEVKELLEGMGIIQFNQSYFKLKNSKLLPAAGTLLSEEATNKYDFLEWLNENHEVLKQNKIKIIQNEDSSSKYFIGKREIKIEVKEQKDWFDVQAMVKFGEFSFPFLSLREYILKGKREFILPNGMIAIIPNEWFGNLSGILEFSKNDDDIQLDKHHIGLLDEIANQGGKYLQLSDKLEQIKNYGQIKEMALPEKFKGELRPYQKAGFDWFYFLKENQFGGCLADDMGLGKTIQTLALLQKEKEFYIKQVGEHRVDLEPEIVFEDRTSNLQHAAPTVQLDLFASNSHEEKQKIKVDISIPNNEVTNNEVTNNIQTPFDSAQSDISVLNDQLTNTKITNNEVTNNTTFIRTSLIIVPNSLVYNWYNEAMKFTPDLKVLVHTGIGRSKSAQVFARYDLIISTYGTARVDVDVFKAFKFNYIILDESQAIKNPQSLSSRAVRQLKSSNRLVLTGTPIENSVQELWSQLSFINSGMFGSLASFTERFVLPIEKGKDLQKLNQLKAIIKPFVLRRTKDQVAQDLPEKTEQVIYCPMSEEQQEAYETVKSYYRNEIIKSIRELGLPRSQFTLLQGLTKLRQIANHPKLSNETYEHGSGKFNEIMYRAETAQAEGHKVLMFSQFVKQLHIFSKYFDEKGIKYAYLDGSLSSEERQRIVSDFQQNEGISFFLISLKAGGVGLNLTSADYVFMIDPWWNPAVERQAVDRAHRIGQKKSVFIYKFITKDTVEEKILALQEKKKNLADSLITTEESFIKNIDVDEIMDILT